MISTNGNIPGGSEALADIDRKAKLYAAARQRLADKVQALNDELEAVKRGHQQGIKFEVEATAFRYSQLHAAIEIGTDLFTKPRSVVLHGIKVGFRKGSGGIDWQDDERVAELINKHMPDQFDILVKTTHKPQAKALQQLDVAELKKIGCTVESTGDVVVIKATDSEIEKAINVLLKAAMEEGVA